jgi:glycerol-3-phosphate dehydrogenase
LTGARVALLEKGDFASGTSSRSTKLLHGGIRYLENLEFDLVAESLKERYIQYKNAPHLVKPLNFVVPVYKDSPRPLWMMKLGVWLYDLLSGDYTLGQRQWIDASKLLQEIPSLKKEGLKGAVSYFDAQMDDARICLENVLMADLKGAQLANYVEVEDFLKANGRCFGVRARDLHSGKVFEVRSDRVIVTAGPWAQELLRKDTLRNRTKLRLTKGVHIVYRHNIGEKAFLLQSSKDKRVFFMIPFHGQTLIGTTDTDHVGSPDRVEVEQKDIDYLLKEAARSFPGIEFSQDKIISSFVGLRPLVYEEGSPSKVSRKHLIQKTFSGIWFMVGGKYTTYRAMAMEAVDKIFARSPFSSSHGQDHPLYGSGKIEDNIQAISQRYHVSAETISYLRGLYGTRYTDVLAMTEMDHSLRAKLCSCSLAIRAQVAYACRVESARTMEDVYYRRLQLQYNDCPTRQCLRSIQDMYAAYLI